MNNFVFMTAGGSDAALTQVVRSDTWRTDGIFDSAQLIFQHLLPSMLSAVLVFLPVSGIPQGLQYLKADTSEGLEPVIDCFDATYLSGSYRRIQRPVDPDGVIPPVKMRRIVPLFPPEL
ncbi:hypothetical protein LSH36_35g02008 [Paralvinella palmiformis]|uniref:Uncharacterized protein n=1 Tax=Paralvinella palmiformis TaxID=53620 RepID=A0AAD9K879_9ANNE|nr:hypothetical protein LSH36_35g02008 [Paralvinella palmiformis]